jgi:iron(III) transport system ATP-binding protein
MRPLSYGVPLRNPVQQVSREKVMNHHVSIQNLVKRFGDVIAVNGVSIEVEKGEIFTLLGPSGCGKTTLLRMIAGFHHIDSGKILFDARIINDVPAHKRDTGMVFQSYAIFPHMTVRENIAYGLKARKFSRNEIKKRVDEALELVQITQLADRKPNELSGGQQQRVALARAFIIEPGVLLMDEPLSNLDAKLRVQMRTVIKKLQRRLGITTIYVTHDQEEALAISDHIAVMKDGRVMQVERPSEVYKHPQNLFVAGFVGTSNLIHCTCTASEGNGGKIRAGELEYTVNLKRTCEGEVVISARPEQLFFSDTGLPGKISISTFLGDFVEYEVLLDSGITLLLNEYAKDSGSLLSDGQRVHIMFDPGRIGVYEKESGELLSAWPDAV